MKHLLRVIVLCGLLLGVMPVVFAQDDAVPEDTTFFLTFVPNVQFAPIYVGLEKGYFAAAGYNVALEYGREPDGVELIATGARQFGLISGEQVLAARANGRPVVYVYEWWQQYPIAVVASAASNISTPADFASGKMGVPGRFGATYTGLTAFLAANDLSEQALDLQEIGFNAPEVLCVGGVDAAAVYGNNEPLQVQARIAAGDCPAVTQLRVFPVAEYVDLVSNGVITSEAMIAQQPEHVRAMVQAFDAALQSVIENPAEAYLLSARHIENLPLSAELEARLQSAAVDQSAFLQTQPTLAALADNRAALAEALRAEFTADELLQFEVLLETLTYWEAEVLGYGELSAWETTQETLLQIGFIDAPIDLQSAFTNEFLPPQEAD